MDKKIIGHIIKAIKITIANQRKSIKLNESIYVSPGAKVTQ